MVPFPVCRPPRYDVRAFPSQFAEMGGEVFGQSQALPDLFRVDVMQRPTAQREFVAQPQRWKIERTFGWLYPRRLLSKEYERTTESSESEIYLASIRLMLRRLASSPT